MNKYGLNLKIKKEGLTSENIKLFADLYNLNFLSSNNLSFVSEQYFNDRNIYILKFINDVKENFSKERYLKYLEFTKTHSHDTSSLDFFIVKYGENLGKQKFDEKCSYTSGSLNSFIKRYGIENGQKAYKNRCNKTKFRGTLEGFIDLYGEEVGHEKYLHWCNQNKGNLTLERMVEIYGEMEGHRRFNIVREKFKNKNTLNYYKQLFGDVEGEKRYRLRNEKNSESTKKQKNAIWRIGTECYYSWLKQMKKKGLNYGLSFEEQEKIVQYYKLVWKETLKQPLHLLPNFEKRGHQREKGSYAIDHKISIYFGFKHNIPFDIIGNIDNLQMLPHSLNASKNTGSYSMIQYCAHEILGERINDFKF